MQVPGALPRNRWQRHFTSCRIKTGCILPLSLIQKQVQEEQEKGGIEISIANALWIEKDFSLLKAYLDLSATHYGAVLNRVDFKHAFDGVRLEINAWVEEKTKNRIKDLIQPGVLDPLTRLVLTKAIYFKGNWASTFKKDKTKDDQFWIAPGKTVRVPKGPAWRPNP